MSAIVDTPLTEDQARALTDRIRGLTMPEAREAIIEAFGRNAAGALGYENWPDYVEGELRRRLDDDPLVGFASRVAPGDWFNIIEKPPGIVSSRAPGASAPVDRSFGT